MQNYGDCSGWTNDAAVPDRYEATAVLSQLDLPIIA